MDQHASCAWVVFALLASACSGRFTFEPKAGTQVHVLENVLEATIAKVQVVPHERVAIFVSLKNLGEQELRFKREGVWLDYGGTSYSARDIRRPEFDVNILPEVTVDKCWEFEVPEDPWEPGEYALRIAGIAFYEKASLTPAGNDLSMKFKLPAPEHR